MVKPGDICMIRKVPENYPGHSLNGSIVRAIKLKPEIKEPLIWAIEPPLKEAKRTFTGCHERWLFPLDPCEDDLAKESLERINEDMQKVFIDKVMEKLYD